MPTIERERYRAALAALQMAQADARRADLMAQIALNRVRDAEAEGFAADAARREERRQALVGDFDRERAAVAHLAGLAEAQRGLAVVEEIDEVAGAFDDALHALLAAIDGVAATAASVTALAERAGYLATSLPEGQTSARQVAKAAVIHARALERQVDRLVDTTTTCPLPPATPHSRDQGPTE